jgi:orotidine-5'-phosphate decarboxylase
MAEIIVALDLASAEEALGMVERLGDRVGFYKVGLELYTVAGPRVVEELVARDKRVFLDLKLHDIPNTVTRAVQAAAALGVDLLTVHASGGSRMMAAARDAAGDGVRLLAVTVLTSLSPDDMGTVWGREIRSVRDEVGRLARLARLAHMDGVVASALEASWVRAQIPRPFVIVTPGIRTAGTDRGDQTRVATPADAVRAGADYLVVGRPVTGAEDPAAAYGLILDDALGAAGAVDP